MHLQCLGLGDPEAKAGEQRCLQGNCRRKWAPATLLYQEDARKRAATTEMEAGKGGNRVSNNGSIGSKVLNLVAASINLKHQSPHRQRDNPACVAGNLVRRYSIAANRSYIPLQCYSQTLSRHLPSVITLWKHVSLIIRCYVTEAPTVGRDDGVFLRSNFSLREYQRDY